MTHPTQLLELDRSMSPRSARTALEARIEHGRRQPFIEVEPLAPVFRYVHGAPLEDE